MYKILKIGSKREYVNWMNIITGRNIELIFSKYDSMGFRLCIKY